MDLNVEIQLRLYEGRSQYIDKARKKYIFLMYNNTPFVHPCGSVQAKLSAPPENWTLPCECCGVRCSSKKGHNIDMVFQRSWTTCPKLVNYSKFISELHNMSYHLTYLYT